MDGPARQCPRLGTCLCRRCPGAVPSGSGLFHRQGGSQPRGLSFLSHLYTVKKRSVSHSRNWFPGSPQRVYSEIGVRGPCHATLEQSSVPGVALSMFSAGLVTGRPPFSDALAIRKTHRAPPGEIHLLEITGLRQTRPDAIGLPPPWEGYRFILTDSRWIPSPLPHPQGNSPHILKEGLS